MNFNILLDNLPKVTPSGLKIRTDFRESIKFELLMQDNKIIESDKLKLALNLYYDEIVDVKKALEDMIWFYKGNVATKQIEISKSNHKNDKTNKKQIYSYEFDDKYIFSAFMEQYRIDLNNIRYMHWWKFKTLLEGLNENIQFVKIMGYRAIELSKIKDKEERKKYKELQSIYALPDMRTIEEKEADFANAFW